MTDLAARFHALFRGLEEAHGTFSPGERKESGKLGGKAVTVRAPVLPALWQAHLDGRVGLGIVPINSDSRCKFGAIDIDIYPLDHLKLVQQIGEAKLPLNVFRSKSGGAHLMLILSDDMPATRMQDILKSWCAVLKLGNIEVFPKQRKLDVLNGDLGNWINAPYFNGDTDHRCLIAADGTDVPLERFMETVRVVAADTVKEDTYALDASPIKDGPPCLQTLSLAGFPEGGRNNGLLNLAVYARKAHPDSWETVTRNFNQKFMQPPLEASEVEALIGSMRKTQYTYKCHDQPINMHCQQGLCRRRKYGIGNAKGQLPIVTNCTKYENEEGGSVWYLEIGDKRVRATDVQLDDQRQFSRLMMNTLNFRPSVKIEEFNSWINSVLDMAAERPVMVPFESTAAGQFRDFLGEFVDLKRSEDRKDVSIGKVYHDVQGKKVYFILDHLLRWLESRKQWRAWNKARVVLELNQAYGGTETRVQDGMRRPRCQVLEFSVLDIKEPPSMTEQKGDVL